ncbi:MAG: (2Fe-2S)-binding protein [Porphyrobacter sp.]|uniref:(2Fe-2S)-binding protein n=1 Tax=Croceibacterium selenioxidans TaxID=2838833 RepID=A0ABS5W0J9_9SPHN|nr:(2Fe-2S)-binding protein [Croceibacterium selenioxidans]MBO9519247.1 (2Fe-2S)-binding protein [Porphyrobacter sp.]MBT2132991.1 (2Fe-2S)-binding protein [Croceibacterium selenioxidans]
MYICVCNAVRECELRRAAQRSCGNAERVYETLGKRPQCGQCLEEADEIIFEERLCSSQLALAAA